MYAIRVNKNTTNQVQFKAQPACSDSDLIGFFIGAKMDSKRCTVCKEVKPIEEYNKDDRDKSGIRSQCKKCQYAVQKSRYQREHYKPAAKDKARDAFVAGKIQKPLFCEICGRKGKLEKHHPDYNKPLEVVWVDRACHSQLHRSHKIA